MRKILLSIALAACGAVGCDGGDTGGSGEGGSSTGSSSTAAPCGEHPLDCPAGQTCWFAAGGAFTCQASGSGKEGEACAPIVDEPSCSDGLLCLRESGSDGICTRLCDPSSSEDNCAGKSCVLAQSPEMGETHVCH